MENNPTWICVVAVAMQDENGRWLMQRRPAGKPHAGMWEYPGGKVEADETPANALIREVREELGVKLDVSDIAPAAFAQSLGAKDQSPIVILLYTASQWDGKPAPLEGGELDWFSPNEVMALDMPDLDVKLTKALFQIAAD